jgi:hypothetical protein
MVPRSLKKSGAGGAARASRGGGARGSTKSKTGGADAGKSEPATGDRDAAASLSALVARASKSPLTPSGIEELSSGLQARSAFAALAKGAESFDERATTALALAAVAAGHPPDGRLLRKILPVVETLEDLVFLVGRAAGDPEGPLLDLAREETLDEGSQCALLWALAVRREGEEGLARLLTALRLQARLRPHDHACIALLLAAKKLKDPELDEVVRRSCTEYYADEVETVGRKLVTLLRKAGIEDLLELRRGAAEPEQIDTIRRSVPRVGRNDPCPCGSGAKYKKCCEAKDRSRLVESSPVPGLTMEEYRQQAHLHMNESELAKLRTAEMARLPLAELSTAQLGGLFRRFVSRHWWGEAERVADLLAGRPDLSGGTTGDDFRSAILDEALRAGNESAARRQIAKLERPEQLNPVLRIGVELFAPRAQTLGHLNALALHVLLDPDERGKEDLSRTVLDLFPPLGILVARGTMDFHRPEEGDVVLDDIERARDRLGLSPVDPSEESWELLLRSDEQVEGLRETLASASRESRSLRDDLREAREEIGRLEAEAAKERRRSEPKGSAPPAERPASEPAPPLSAPPLDEEKKRLRARIDELEAMLRSKNEEGAGLRHRLRRLERGGAPTAPPRPAPAPVDPEPEEGIDGELSGETRRTIVPLAFERAFDGQLEGVPAPVARKALETSAALAAGDPAAWRGVKYLEGREGTLSARIGIHYRLLFELDDAPRRLRVTELVSRSDFETAIRRKR